MDAIIFDVSCGKGINIPVTSYITGTVKSIAVYRAKVIAFKLAPISASLAEGINRIYGILS